MPEVFTISGSGFGATASCPPGWELTKNGNCGAPSAGCAPANALGAACRSGAALALQNALRTLGKAVGGDTKLMSVDMDGFVGPQTTDAVNRAFTTHIGAGQAPAQYRTGALTISQIAAAAPAITGLISAEVAKRGSVVPPIPTPSKVAAKAPGVTPVSPMVVAGPPKALWALAGLMAIGVGAGVYMTYRS
jgi:hypothetical protein